MSNAVVVKNSKNTSKRLTRELEQIGANKEAEVLEI